MSHATKLVLVGLFFTLVACSKEPAVEVQAAKEQSQSQVDVQAQAMAAAAYVVEEYVGAEACQSCHLEQKQAWLQSDHAKSMLPANKDSVLADFSNIELEYHGIRSRLYEQSGQYFIETSVPKSGDSESGSSELGSSGKLEKKTFEIKYTFGYYPLQQYLVEIGNGHIQALNITWDSRAKSEGGQRWFHLRENEALTADHPFFWTRHFQNWNVRCADCHSTNLKKHYSVEDHSYATLFTDVNVACEACHGPGSNHLAQVQSGSLDHPDLGFTKKNIQRGQWAFAEGSVIAHRKVGGEAESEIDSEENVLENQCGACHARRSQLKSYEHSEDFSESFHLSLVNEPLYHLDGQIRDEVFVLGSFSQSKMAAAGVSCLDCHDAHTGKVYTQDNSLCLQCHKPEAFDTPKHRGHEKLTASDSATQCVTCHMPETVYMQVDARRDHSFSLPRPDLSEKFDVPNTCSTCHKAMAIKDQLTAIDSWRAVKAEHYQPKDKARLTRSILRKSDLVSIKHQLNRQNPLVIRDILALANDPYIADIERATLSSGLASTPSQRGFEYLRNEVESTSLLRQKAALSALMAYPNEVVLPVLISFVEQMDLPYSLKVSLGDLLVTRLASLEPQLNQKQYDVFNQWIDAYRQSLVFNQDTPQGNLALANLALAEGDQLGAQRYIEAALKIEPAYAPALLNAADYYRALGDEDTSKIYYQKALSVDEDNAAALFAYGLYWVRKQNYAEASNYLNRALSAQGSVAQYHLAYALLLIEQQKFAEAEEVLRTANEQWPYQYDVLMTLVEVMTRQSKLELAGAFIASLTELAPGDASVQQWVNAYRQATQTQQQ